MSAKQKSKSAKVQKSTRTHQRKEECQGGSSRKPTPPSGTEQPLSLDEAARYLVEECRMILPDIQALFGFQLIAVFNQRFTTLDAITWWRSPWSPCRRRW